MSSARAAEFVIADQHAIRLAAQLAVFLFVDLLEQGALIEFGRLFQVFEQIALADVQHADLEVFARFGMMHQIVQPAPGRFQLLEIGVVHDFVDLRP